MCPIKITRFRSPLSCQLLCVKRHLFTHTTMSEALICISILFIQIRMIKNVTFATSSSTDQVF